MFGRRPRAANGARRPGTVGTRLLALTGSAAGVLVVAAGVAIVATAGGHDSVPVAASVRAGAGTHQGHLHVAGPTHAAAGSHADPRNVSAFNPLADPRGAYPPRTSCSLAVVRTTSTSTSTPTTTVEGNGLGPAQAVTVAYYSATAAPATLLGTWRTDRDGSFDGSTRVPDTGYVTASTQSAQCSTPAGSGAPAYPPTTGSTGPSTPSTPTSGPTGGPPTSSSPTSGSTGSSSTSTSTSTGAQPSHGSSAAPGSAGSTPSGATSAPAGSSGAAPSSGATSAGNGSVQSGSPTPSPTTTQAAISAQSWGLPTSFIVTMALVLLVLGGLAVLVLTRRSG